MQVLVNTIGNTMLNICYPCMVQTKSENESNLEDSDTPSAHKRISKIWLNLDVSRLDLVKIRQIFNIFLGTERVIGFFPYKDHFDH
jgi:hypothetical protein